MWALAPNACVFNLEFTWKPENQKKIIRGKWGNENKEENTDDRKV